MNPIETAPATIMIVDDTPENITVLRQLLSKHGYQTRPAIRGDLALHVARNTPPDLVLLDIRMPGMDGFEVCRQLKADERLRDIPVIFITIADDASDKVKAFALGGVDYITKPFHTDEVLARVQTHLRLRQTLQQLQHEIVLRQQAETELKQCNALLEPRVDERTAALIESQTLLHAIVDSTSDMIWSVDAERFGLLMFNRSLRDYFLQSRGIRIALGMRPEELFPSDDFIQQWRAFYQRTLREGSYSTEYLVYARTRTLQLSFNLLQRDGVVFGVSVFGKDITERKQAEDQIKQSLREKETLLRELYHRTKNNMQVIRAMMMMRAASSPNVEIDAFVREIEQKIMAMALVHQKLYEAQDLSWIRFDEYVADVAALTLQGYQVTTARIALRSELEPVSVLLDTAMPCGVIVNELIANALKHAFPDKRAGEIRIRVCRAADGAVALHVADNGVGVPDGFDLRKQATLGLQTVVALVERQLKGTILVEREQGTAFAIRFHDNLYTARV